MRSGNILNYKKKKNLELYIGLIIVLYVIVILFLPEFITINHKILLILKFAPILLLFFIQNFEVKFFFLLIMSFGYQVFLNESLTISNFSFFIPLILIFIVYKRESLFQFKPNFTTKPLVLFLVSALINFLFSKSFSLSGHLLINYFQAFIIGYYLILFVNNKRKFYYLIFFLSLSSLYPIALGLLYSGSATGDPVNRVSGSFMSSNEFAAYLAFYFFFFSGLMLFVKKISLKIISLCFIIVTFYLFLNTFSRGAMLGFALSFLTLLFLMIPKERKLSGAFIAGLTIIISFISFLVLDGMKYLNRFFVAGDSSVDFSTIERLGIWRSGILMFKESPIIGFGLNTFQKYYPSYFPSYGIGLVSNRHKHAHNIIINTLAEQGVIGFIFLVAILVLIFRSLWKLYKHERDLGKVRFSAIFISFYVYFIVHNCFDTIWTVYHHVALFVNLVVFLVLIVLYEKYFLKICQ